MSSLKGARARAGLPSGQVMADRDYYSHTARSVASTSATPYDTPRSTADYSDAGAVERHRGGGGEVVRASDYKPALSLLKQEILSASLLCTGLVPARLLTRWSWPAHRKTITSSICPTLSSATFSPLSGHWMRSMTSWTHTRARTRIESRRASER